MGIVDTDYKRSWKTVRFLIRGLRLNQTTISEIIFLLMNGNGQNNKKIELINSTSRQTKVLQYPFEKETYGSVGGVLSDHVVVCAGSPYIKTCHILGRDCQWKWFKELKKERIAAASIVRTDQFGVSVHFIG